MTSTKDDELAEQAPARSARPFSRSRFFPPISKPCCVAFTGCARSIRSAPSRLVGRGTKRLLLPRQLDRKFAVADAADQGFPRSGRPLPRHRSKSVRPAPGTARSAPGNRRRCLRDMLPSTHPADSRAPGVFVRCSAKPREPRDFASLCSLLITLSPRLGGVPAQGNVSTGCGLLRANLEAGLTRPGNLHLSMISSENRRPPFADACSNWRSGR